MQARVACLEVCNQDQGERENVLLGIVLLLMMGEGGKPTKRKCRGKGEGEKGRRQSPGAAFVLSLL